MKIAYIVPSLIKSGPIKVVHQLVEALQKEHAVEIFYFKVPEREKLSFSVPTYKIKFNEPIDFDTYDIIHSHTILADAYVWFHRNKIKQAKTVTTLHTYAKEGLLFAYGKVKSFFLLRLWKIVISKHDKIVVLSKDAVHYYKNMWDIENITFVYNGIRNTKIMKYDHIAPPNKIIKIGVIASAGGISRGKGIDQVIEAISKLESHELYIAGKETEESIVLKKQAQKLGVLKQIHFLGYVDNMASFLENMDLFVLPTRLEGLPLSLLEIARVGKPVVCSDIPVFKEIMNESEVSFFEMDNIKSLEMAIQKIEENKDVYSDRIQKAFFAKFTAEKMAENYLKVYEDLIKGKGNA